MFGIDDAIIGGLIAGGGSLLGGLFGSRGTEKAAETQASAADRAAELQYKMWQEQQQLQAPWRQAGEQALNKLLPLAQNYQKFGMAEFQRDPGYSFRLSESLKGIDRQAAARGGLISGPALKAAGRFAGQEASNEYSNAFNRYLAERNAELGPLQSLAGLGQTSVNYLGQQAGQYGQMAGEYGTQAANARASGYVGQANALNQALGGVGNAAMNYAYMNRFAPQGGAPTGWSSGGQYVPYGDNPYGV